MGILNKLFSKDPDKLRALAETAVQNKDVDKLNALAFKAVQDGDSYRSIDLLKQAILIEPNNHKLLYGLGVCQFGIDQYKDSESSIRAALKHDPGNAQYLKHLLACQLSYFLTVKDSKSILELANIMLQDLSVLLDASPTSGFAYVEKANVLAATGAKREEWENALKIAAEMYEQEGKLQSGERATKQALSEVIISQRIGCVRYEAHANKYLSYSSKL